MTPLQALIDARALLAEPERWTQGAYAKTESGHACVPESTKAACWCLAGALHRSTLPGHLRKKGPYWEALDAVATVLAFPSAIEWNDAPERTHAEVLAAFDAAIARLQEHAE